MNRLVAVIALAGALAGCDAKSPPAPVATAPVVTTPVPASVPAPAPAAKIDRATYTERVKIDDV